ncbi:RING-H2 finger protein ATL63 [Gossypium australe]|uniref:RING-H2 finger protein ATL63 n=1 Tax=Gossypium australe TaxID=47621 RepID=A0A5B6W500_9ROSI|nr:RING-H2 finger protein ATL63 [Gossypium australe]
MVDLLLTVYDYIMPTLTKAKSSIIRPNIAANNFEIKSNTIQMVQQLFPFSLRNKAKQWLNSLSRGSITTWAQMTEKFLLKYFRPAKIAKLRNEISSFAQFDLERLYNA